MAKKKDELHAVAPVLRVAPLGQLNVYTITEDELNSLKRGSPGSLFLNFGLALTPVSFAFLITILSTSISSIEGKIFFIAGTIIFGLAGVIFLLLAWYYHDSVKTVVERIKNRMPPPEPIAQEVTNVITLAQEAQGSIERSGAEIPPPTSGIADSGPTR